MSRSVFSVIAALALAAGAAGLPAAAAAASPTMGGYGTQQQVPTSSRMDQSAMVPMRPLMGSTDNGRCPTIYSEPGHEVFGGAGCAGGGGPNAPRDRSGRLD
jgi:hypothetical protein